MDEYSIVSKIGDNVYKISPKLFYRMKGVYSSVANANKYKEQDPSMPGKISSVNIELSIRCNLRCSFCWWWGEKGIGFEYSKNKDPMVVNELTTEEIISVINQTSAYNPSYYLSGGEPFIRKDTLDIIRHINGRGLKVGMTTNGTLLNDLQLQELATFKNLLITFSLDGTREVHDKIRGNGNFDRTIANIRKLVEYRGKAKYPIIRTNTTFSPFLLGHTVDLAEYLQDTGVNMIFFQHLWFTDQQHAENQKKFLKSIFGIEENGTFSHVISAPTQIYAKQLADEISAIQNHKFKVPIFIRPQMTSSEIVQYYTNLNFTKSKRCVAPWTGLIIKANGDALFCPDEWITQWRIGNVRDQSVESIWNSEKAKKFRTEINKYGLFPACARCCAIN